ncbi:Carbon monoxide oxidation accessory protein CoxG [plant metagenome]|uniref:Carbon monoxide oxidation accessory protein CoxG n=1 Tax=plant metagenome TaxID=1297885 RepID=A0A484RQW0_9ZZZZ
MRIADAQWIPAAQHQVWDALNDPAILQRCIPGCVLVEKLADTEFALTVQTQVGGMEAAYQGELLLADVDAPNSCTLAFEGKGRAAGLVIGTAQINLSTKDRGTRLAYTVASQVGGKVAALGDIAVRRAAERIIEKFFTAFIDYASGLPRTEPPPAPEEPQRGLCASRWSWLAVVAVVVVLALYHFFVKK